MKRNKCYAFLGLSLFCFYASAKDIKKEVQEFLNSYNRTYQKKSAAYQNAQWNSNVRIVEGDSSNAIKEKQAGEAYSAFVGADSNLQKATLFLENGGKGLSEIQIKQLKQIIYLGAYEAASQKALISQRLQLETKQIEKLFGHDYTLDGKSISTNDIDEMLINETDTSRRRKVWEASKEAGKNLKPGLAEVANIRNKIVRAAGFKDYFDYCISEYGMTSDEMLTLLHDINKQLYPLFRELHTYARYELAKKYNVSDIPDYLPAHWLPNRWAQDWSPMIKVEGLNLDKALSTHSPEWIVKTAEQYYTSMGLGKMPASFWTKSSLYPLAPGASYKKNNHASCWHINLDNDIRSLMSVLPNTYWFGTSHHELGHGYYFKAYSNPKVPFILRTGANRSFHEAIGNLISLVSNHQSYLKQRNLISSDAKTDAMQVLLQEAMENVVLMPFAAGTMPQFEHELYANNLTIDQYNKKWWEIAKRYQGIVPPTERGEMYCDAATKSHINDFPAKYYDYALSYLIVFQLNDYISKNILHEDPHNSNFYKRKDVGTFLQKILSVGMTKDWRKLLKEATGEELSARAMLAYYNPLLDYLKKINQGRKYTLPETME